MDAHFTEVTGEAARSAWGSYLASCAETALLHLEEIVREGEALLEQDLLPQTLRLHVEETVRECKDRIEQGRLLMEMRRALDDDE